MSSQTAISTEDDYLLDEQVGYLLRLANQRHTAIFQSRDINGLTATQFSAMLRLYQYGESSQNQLGRYSAMDVATIKGVIDRLRQKGLVRTEPFQNDKRRNLISLTPEGATMIEDLKKTGRDITQETLAPLTASERQKFITLLTKLT
jgi:DNA-binding MarR family transcriptional regulator